MATTLDPAQRAQTPARRRLDIQGLRAFAVVVVILFHADLPVPGGFIGVDVFFVISGYVITSMLMREWDEHGRLSFGRFYLRRFRRLSPALALVVSVTMVLSFFLLSPLGGQQAVAQTGIAAMLFVANFVIARITGDYFAAPAESNPLLNTWSLSVEEQFYFIFPAALAIAWWIAARARRPTPHQSQAGPRMMSWAAFAVVAAIALISFGLTFIEADSLALGFYSPLTRAWEFALGALAALSATTVRSRALATAMGIAGLALCLISLWVIDVSTPWPSYWTLLPTVGTILLIQAGTNADNPVSRGLSWRGLTATGDRSYSLYLWHWPLIVFAGLIWGASVWILCLAALISTIPAALSYRFVEQPIRFSQRHTLTVVMATLSIPVGLAALLWVISGQSFGSEKVSAYREATSSQSAADLNGCDQGLPANEVPESCMWNSSAPGTPLLLLGDSNAAHFSEALIGASDALEAPLLIAAATGCPFIATDFTQSAFSKRQQKECQRYISETLSWLDEQPPSTVVISSSDRIVTSNGFTFLPSGFRGNTPEGHEIFGDALTQTVRRIQQAGHTVVLVQVVPHWSGRGSVPLWDPTRCNANQITNGDCGESAPIEAAYESSAVSRAAIQATAAETGALVLDLTERMCPDGLCSTMQGDLFAYRDGSHITPTMSRLLAPEFIAILGN